MEWVAGVFGLVYLALCCMAAWRVYEDAKRRGMLAPLWTALVLLFGPLGFIVYMALRRKAK